MAMPATTLAGTAIFVRPKNLHTEALETRRNNVAARQPLRKEQADKE